jgi:hypothetical protein
MIGPMPACEFHGELESGKGKPATWREYPSLGIRSRLLVCRVPWCFRWVAERVVLFGLLIVYLTGCPSKSIDRKLDESLREDIQWQQSAAVEKSNQVDQSVNKSSRKVTRTPLISPSGHVVTDLSGQPVFSVEEVDEHSDSSTSAKTDLRGQSNSTIKANSDSSKSSRDKSTTDWHAWKLRILAAVMAVGLVAFVWVSVRRKWF